MFIDAFLEYLSLEKKYSSHTVLAYKTDLIAFKDFCVVEFDQESLENVHYNQIRNWIVSLVDQGVTNRTINRKVSSLKTFYKFLQKIEEIEVNPLAKHKALKTQKKQEIPFSIKEMENVFVEFNEDDFVSLRDKLIVELFYSTGMRRIELINIKRSDVSLSSKTIKVLGKRNKERIVPLIPTVIETLEKYLAEKREINTNTEHLLITEKGNKIYETLVYRVINRYFSKVSTKTKKSPHILRHTFATQLLNQGADLNSVKELLGHSSLASTQVYTHNNLEQLKQVFNKAHPRSKKKD
ncbi:tyrosine-type recombinase/integrase [uncultured Tenacibaculum sp.]|uniref:tyrosine-type recombinase/integrase n=1 Tax=uncultured Tenacibaculum sp. TaxID=174713 RepID=UPI002617952A|nr:tyrosine-type recombinase/integrase [uncultured Tenacibaculum sp.]